MPQFVEIIVFAAIALFLIMRLRSVLGQRDEGEDQRHHVDPFSGRDAKGHPTADKNAKEQKGKKDTPAADTTEPVPAPAHGWGQPATLSEGFSLIREADPSFEPDSFVEGAKGAFEMIVSAFAKGDLDTLENLLSDDVFEDFKAAIEEREEAGHQQTITVEEINSVDILEAYLEGSLAQVTVKFVTEQINVTRNQDGKIVTGKATKPETVTDIWTFARETRSDDPNWLLVATRSLD